MRDKLWADVVGAGLEDIREYPEGNRERREMELTQTQQKSKLAAEHAMARRGARRGARRAARRRTDEGCACSYEPLVSTPAAIVEAAAPAAACLATCVRQTLSTVVPTMRSVPFCDSRCRCACRGVGIGGSDDSERPPLRTAPSASNIWRAPRILSLSPRLRITYLGIPTVPGSAKGSAARSMAPMPL